MSSKLLSNIPNIPPLYQLFKKKKDSLENAHRKLEFGFTRYYIGFKITVDVAHEVFEFSAL